MEEGARSSVYEEDALTARHFNSFHILYILPLPYQKVEKQQCTTLCLFQHLANRVKSKSLEDSMPCSILQTHLLKVIVKDCSEKLTAAVEGTGRVS